MTALLKTQPRAHPVHIDPLDRKCSRTRGPGGFTLLELLVSIALMAFILTILGAGLRTISNGWNKYSDQMSEQDMLLRAFSLIRRDFAKLQRITWSADKPEFVFRGGTGNLQFVAIEPPYPSLPGPYILNYVANGERAGTLSRSRARFHPEIGSLARADFRNKVPLIEGPYTYRFSYAEEVAGTERNSRSLQWFATWPYSDKLPDLIRLIVRDTRPGKTGIAPLTVRPRVNAEQACVSKKAKGCTLKLIRDDTQTQSGQQPEGTEKP